MIMKSVGKMWFPGSRPLASLLVFTIATIILSGCGSKEPATIEQVNSTTTEVSTDVCYEAFASYNEVPCTSGDAWVEAPQGWSQTRDGIGAGFPPWNGSKNERPVLVFTPIIQTIFGDAWLLVVMNNGAANNESSRVTDTRDRLSRIYSTYIEDPNDHLLFSSPSSLVLKEMDNSGLLPRTKITGTWVESNCIISMMLDLGAEVVDADRLAIGIFRQALNTALLPISCM